MFRIPHPWGEGEVLSFLITGISSKKVREDLERKVKDDPTESLGLCSLTSFSVLTGRLVIQEDRDPADGQHGVRLAGR